MQECEAVCVYALAAYMHLDKVELKMRDKLESRSVIIQAIVTHVVRSKDSQNEAKKKLDSNRRQSLKYLD